MRCLSSWKALSVYVSHRKPVLPPLVKAERGAAFSGKVRKAQESLDFFKGLRDRQISYCLKLSGIHLEATGFQHES